MKITLAEVKSLESSLSKIFNKDVNIKLAYRLGKLLKRLSEEMKMLEENRIKLVKKYGEEDEETKQLSVPPEKTQEFYNEFNELMQIEIDVDFEPVPLEQFGDIEMSASDVINLDGKIIADESPAEKEKTE